MCIFINSLFLSIPIRIMDAYLQNMMEYVDNRKSNIFGTKMIY